MLPIRFSLRFLLSIVSMLCVIAWAITPSSSPPSIPLPSISRAIAAVFILSLVGAYIGWVRGTPVRYGAAYGGGATLVLILCYWPIFISGYFFYSGPDPYFEDGGILEIFVYPIVYCIVYTPVGAFLGTAVGCVLSSLLSVPKQPTQNDRKAKVT
jgi:hypothetical protein